MITKIIKDNLLAWGGFWRDGLNRKVFLGAIIMGLAQTAILILVSGDLPPEVPLFYSLPWGESQLVAATELSLLPVLSFGVIALNAVLAVYVEKKSSSLARVLTVTSLIFNLLALVGLIQIIYLMR